MDMEKTMDIESQQRTSKCLLDSSEESLRQLDARV